MQGFIRVYKGLLWCTGVCKGLQGSITSHSLVLLWDIWMTIWLGDLWWPTMNYTPRYPRQPSPQVTLAYKKTLSLFLFKIEPTLHIRITNPSLGTRQLRWTSFLALAGMVTLARGTTSFQINALAHMSHVTSVSRTPFFNVISKVTHFYTDFYLNNRKR